ncbi:MAG: 5'/3'-nucleotidase SurE [Chitinophagales bacterium]|nr:5'/3'-nucleotidase SurE [Chitinophagales bacterium]
MAKQKNGSGKPTILVTNDDGITSPGLKALVEAVKDLGDILVVAPDKPQSGMGHAITIGVPLRLEKVDIFGDIPAWQCSGTPVDCVKLAKDKLLHHKPDLCVSGVNHGANSSINVIYSGTMSAAVEAAIEGINAVGFSLCDYSFYADFSASMKYARMISKEMLRKDIPEGTLLNVNIPKLPIEKIKGTKVCRQANARWEEDYEVRKDPRGKEYYWITGNFVNDDDGTDTDEWALANGYVSIVPTQFDMTAHHAIPILNQKFNFNEQPVAKV